MQVSGLCGSAVLDSCCFCRICHGRAVEQPRRRSSLVALPDTRPVPRYTTTLSQRRTSCAPQPKAPTPCGCGSNKCVPDVRTVECAVISFVSTKTFKTTELWCLHCFEGFGGTTVEADVFESV